MTIGLQDRMVQNGFPLNSVPRYPRIWNGMFWFAWLSELDCPGPQPPWHRVPGFDCPLSGSDCEADMRYKHEK